MKLGAMARRFSELISNPISTATFRVFITVLTFAGTAAIWSAKTWLKENFATVADVQTLRELPPKIDSVQTFIAQQTKANELELSLRMEQSAFATATRRDITELKSAEADLRAQLTDTKASSQATREQLIRLEVQQEAIAKQLDRLINQSEQIRQAVAK